MSHRMEVLIITLAATQFNLSATVPQNALDFDDVDDYVSFDALTSASYTGGFSAEFWVRPTTNSDGVEHYLLSFDDVIGTNQLNIRYRPNNDRFLFTSNGQSVFNTGNLVHNNWYHIALSVAAGWIG